jgi:hypothetical protein
LEDVLRLSIVPTRLELAPNLSAVAHVVARSYFDPDDRKPNSCRSRLGTVSMFGGRCDHGLLVEAVLAAGGPLCYAGRWASGNHTSQEECRK